MDRIDRYIFRQLPGPFFGALLGALALMMLERMLRLIDVVAESESALGYVFDMLANLVPHYLGIAIPAALFLACYVGYRRLAETSELASFAGLGRGLARLAVPAMIAALFLAAASAYVHSHLQPHGRYAFRSLGFLAANASIASALESGAFIEVGDLTFMAEKSITGGQSLARVFVHERKGLGETRTITSTNGALLHNTESGRAQINFEDGLVVNETAENERSIITFRELFWPIDRSALAELQPRGYTERELTSPELWAAMDKPPARSTTAKVKAEFHGRAARALTVLLVPFLAIPLAAAGGRTRSSTPLLIGIIVFLFHIQMLQFAEGYADLGTAPAALLIWTPFSLFALGSVLLFWRAWRGVGFDPTFPTINWGALKPEVVAPAQ
jgi:lipopolysaccharide export system permease protein